MTAAAVILIAEGGLGLLYVSVLMGGDLVQPVGILIVAFTELHIVAGIGLLRLHGWARFASGAIAAVSLVFLYAPSLAVSFEHGAWIGYDWLGVAGYLVVLFAVLRRWPAELKG